MEGLTTKCKDRGIKLATKVKLVKALMFPIVGPTVPNGEPDDEESRKKDNWCIWDEMLEASGEIVVDGERNQCMGAGKHDAGVDIGIEGGTSIFKILWTCGERGTRNGKWCHARGDEWKEKARKAKNKMAGQYEHHKRTVHYQHEIGSHRSRQMEKCYRGCRQGSDTTRRHKVTRWPGVFIILMWCLLKSDS